MNCDGRKEFSVLDDVLRLDWISGRQLMKAARLGKNDLVRYVRLGILPKPVIRFNGLKPKGSRKNGYFPKSVLERIKMVEQLRKQGHPMDQIVQKFKTGADDENRNPATSGNARDLPLPEQEPARPDSAAAEQPDLKETTDSFVQKVRAGTTPLPVSLSALAVQLDDWCRWQTSLLAGDYHILLDRLLSTASDVFSRHDGVFAFQPPAGMICYFVEPVSEDYLSRAIRCALDLDLAISRASEIWENQHGNLGKIRLNTGLHAGMEQLCCVEASGGDQIIALGPVSEIASQLAAIAKSGQTWASKDIFNRLGPETLRGIKFGISKLQDRWEVFLPGCFSKIHELVALNVLKSPFLEGVDQLAVTRLIEFRADKDAN